MSVPRAGATTPAPLWSSTESLFGLQLVVLDLLTATHPTAGEGEITPPPPPAVG